MVRDPCQRVETLDSEAYDSLQLMFTSSFIKGMPMDARWMVWPVSVACLLGITMTAQAQDDLSLPDPEPNRGSLAFELGVDWTSAYYFRGLLQEDDGFIIQPWAEASARVYQSDDSEITLIVGIWNSVHDAATGAMTSDRTLEKWYEFDIYGGASFSLDAWTFTALYTAFISPSDAFSTVEEITLEVAYDDTGLLAEDFALNPYVLLAIETHDPSGEDGYLELGIAPSFEVTAGDVPIDLSVPITIGLGLEDYYVDADGDNELFGFVDVGLDATIDLPIPDDFGSWMLTGRIHGLFLGDANADANNGDDVELIGSIGITVSY